jgi:hypothetical protein
MLFLIMSVCACASALAQTPGTIVTIVGNGYLGFGGDNGPAVSAQLNTPTDLAVDAQGNLYIADSGNHRVRKMDPSGVIMTVAGNGQPGYGGDGGPAISAQINRPERIALDRSGNLYIADNGNHRIRKVDLQGIITTFAGNGAPGHTGDGGLAISATLSEINGMSVDARDNVYFSDEDRVSKISASNGMITTVIGGGDKAPRDTDTPTQTRYSQIRGLVTPFESVAYFVTGNSVLQSYGQSILAGGGEPDSPDDNRAYYSSLNRPWGLAWAVSGNVYIADTGNNRIQRVNFVPFDRLYTIETIAGTEDPGYSGDGGLARKSGLNQPQSAVIDPHGNLLIADTRNHAIRKV